jgi:hypothetical protein
MFRWITSDNKRRLEAEWPRVVVRVTAPQGEAPVRVGLELETDGTDASGLVARTRHGRAWDVAPEPVEGRPEVSRHVNDVDPRADRSDGGR